ncbi:hypothetical protein F511_25413 [Dorcoceras hygrometricum]|uniref:Uncharacterized protein n=1 Tax=Dorcoceras hygrometricum TaxID=472368 RepID=A0A2Z7AGU7_9LAMI|nr:hypothetical protein F511_25413 [Dorcoceras hygrometricum]
MDSLQTAVKRCVYIIVKYMEMLLRKFLEARRSNFVFDTPTSAIDLKILDFLSDAHRIVLEKLMEHMKIHMLEWTRPSFSSLFECDIQHGRILSRFHPSVKYWVRIWIHDRVALGLFKGNVNLNSSSSSSNTSSGPQIDFTDDIPEIPSSDDVPPVEETTIVIPHISLPTVVPSTDYTEAFAQIRATVDKISLEQFQTRFHIDELKANLSKKISNLETAFHTASDNQDRVVLVQNNVLRKEMQVQKAALGKIAAVEVCSLLTIVADLDLEIVEEVEAAAVNRQGKEEVDIEEEEVQVLGDGIVGSVEKFFVFSSLYKYLVLSQL